MAKTICSSGKETLEKHFLEVNDKTKNTFQFFKSVYKVFYVSFVIISLILPFEAKTSSAKYCFE